MPDLLLDALPVIDLLEITGNTNAVAQLTGRDQSSVSRIYRQASDRLGLAFSKGLNGDYRASANQALLRDLRRSSQRLRLLEPASLRWMGCRWSPPPDDATLLPQPLGHRWIPRPRLCQLVRDHLLDMVVMPGLELLPDAMRPDAAPAEIPLPCGGLLALPLLRQPLLIAAPAGHPLSGQIDLAAVDLRPWALRPPEPEGEPAPRLRRELLARGLRLTDRERPNPATPPLQLIQALELQAATLDPSPLRPAPAPSGLQELDFVVVRRDLREEPALVELLQSLVELHHRHFGQRDDVRLLR